MKRIKTNFVKVAPKKVTKVVLTEETTTKFLENSDGSFLHVGIGKHKDIDLRKFIKACRKVIRTAKQQHIEDIAVQFSQTPFKKLKQFGDEAIVSTMAQNFEMANYEFVKHKTAPKEGFRFIKQIYVCGDTSAKEKKAYLKGQTIGEYVNLCRTIANTPGGDMTPQLLASEAKKAAGGLPVKVTAFDEKKLKELKAGGILGVGKGSKFPPRLIVMEYWGAGKPKASKATKRPTKGKAGINKNDPVVLVGKGITFDTGGLSLKPSASMLGMHMDMSGGAAVIATIALVAKLKLKKNIVAIVPAVENMIGGESYRPGDVLRSMSGKTIEVLNTDAEGRVVLADALHYAKKYSPKLCVDVATLTGAAVVALGERANAFMTRDKKFHKLFQELGEESGDYMWPLPLWDEYLEDIKGTHGDLTNANNNGKPYGGTITAAMFLAQFAGDMPWVHVDMAPRMNTIPSDELARGASGEPVRFLYKLLEEY